MSHALGKAPTAQPPGTLGRCAAPLADLPTDDVHALLGQAAETRLRAKAGALAAVAARTDWRQALWEGLFTALGYKQNSWHMRRLAELLPELGQAHPAKGRVDVSWTAPGQPARTPTGPGRVLVVATQLCPLAGRLGLPDRNQADPGGGITRAPHRQRRVLVDTLDISLRSISQG